jgi:hypothetical protein
VGPAIARYDGNAEWYDETFSAFHNEDEEAWSGVPRLRRGSDLALLAEKPRAA